MDPTGEALASGTYAKLRDEWHRLEKALLDAARRKDKEAVKDVYVKRKIVKEEMARMRR